MDANVDDADGGNDIDNNYVTIVEEDRRFLESLFTDKSQENDSSNSCAGVKRTLSKNSDEHLERKKIKFNPQTSGCSVAQGRQDGSMGEASGSGVEERQDVEAKQEDEIIDIATDTRREVADAPAKAAENVATIAAAENDIDNYVTIVEEDRQILESLFTDKSQENDSSNSCAGVKRTLSKFSDEHLERKEVKFKFNPKRQDVASPKDDRMAIWRRRQEMALKNGRL